MDETVENLIAPRWRGPLLVSSVRRVSVNEVQALYAQSPSRNSNAANALR